LFFGPEFRQLRRLGLATWGNLDGVREGGRHWTRVMRLRYLSAPLVHGGAVRRARSRPVLVARGAPRRKAVDRPPRHSHEPRRESRSRFPPGRRGELHERSEGALGHGLQDHASAPRSGASSRPTSPCSRNKTLSSRGARGTLPRCAQGYGRWNRHPRPSLPPRRRS